MQDNKNKNQDLPDENVLEDNIDTGISQDNNTADITDSNIGENVDENVEGKKLTEEEEKELLARKRAEQVELYKKHFEIEKENKAKGHQMQKETEELEKSLEKLYSIRKFVYYICGAMWLFALIGLIGRGIEMSIFLPLMLFALALLSGINAPIFFKKDKVKDTFVSIIVVFVCVFLAVIILFS